MSKTHDQTPVRACEHCGNRAPMSILVTHPKIETQGVEEAGTVTTWEEGVIYSLLECISCERPVLLRYYYHEFVSPEEEDPEVLFPGEG